MILERKTGTIYLCATPIGNLEDITLRVLRILKEVDYIAAEDTRHTLRLLNHFEISKPLISYHEYNKREAGEKIISLVNEGYNIALASDAGMPGISDPGSDLVSLAHERGVKVTILPGATAGLSALVLSGLDTERFVFEGFLPRVKKDRKIRLEKLMGEERTIILYEAPHRLLTTLGDLLEAFGNRNIAVIRELTKLHEEIIKTDIRESIAHFKDSSPRGEFVLVLEGAAPEPSSKAYEGLTIEQHIREYMEKGFSKKEAIKQVAVDREIPKSEVYSHSIGIDRK